jgi:hypothetical protein
MPQNQPQAPAFLQNLAGLIPTTAATILPDLAAGIADIPLLAARGIGNLLTSGGAETRDPLTNLLVSLGEKIQGAGIPTSGEEVKQLITKQFPESYQQSIEHPNFISELIQKSSRVLPAALATGGTSLAAQVPVIGGILPEVTLKRLGAGPGWQLLANLVGSFGTAWLQKVGSASNIEKMANTAEKALYKEAGTVAPNVYANVEPITNAINTAEQIASESTLGVYNDVLPELLDIQNKLQMTGGRIPVANLQSAKRKVNQLIGSTGGWLKKFDPIEQRKREIYGNVLGAIKGELTETATTHPEWGVPFFKAEELHRATNAKGIIRDIMKKVEPSEIATIAPLTKKLLSGAFGSLKGAAKTAAWGLTGGLAAKEMMKYYDMLSKSPQIRQMVFQMTADAAEHNVPSFLGTLHKLDDMVTQTAAQPNYTIIRRGPSRQREKPNVKKVV